MNEPNQVLWRGIRPVDPPEYIPVLPYKPDAVQYRVYSRAQDETVESLNVPAGNVYHIINIYVHVPYLNDGSGSISLTDSNNHILQMLGYYRIGSGMVIGGCINLMAPINLLETEKIILTSNDTNFVIFCSIIYTKE